MHVEGVLPLSIRETSALRNVYIDADSRRYAGPNQSVECTVIWNAAVVVGGICYGRAEDTVTYLMRVPVKQLEEVYGSRPVGWHSRRS